MSGAWSVATARLGSARLLAASPKYDLKPESSKMDGASVATARLKAASHVSRAGN